MYEYLKQSCTSKPSFLFAFIGRYKKQLQTYRFCGTLQTPDPPKGRLDQQDFHVLFRIFGRSAPAPRKPVPTEPPHS